MAKKENAKAIVTGGAGFIGSHLADLLAKKGWKVYSLDNYIASENKLLLNRKNPAVSYLKCDMRDFEKLKKHFLKIKPRYVFHTAALARIQPSIKDPETYLKVNSLGTLNVLRASAAAGAKRVVYSASSSAYGTNPIPLRESMPPIPLNPYAKTKLDGEQWMRIFSELYGLETVSLRYFNVYGPRNLFFGAYTTVVTRFLHLFREGKPMTIVGDGKQTRDYTHVYDVARANYLAAVSKKAGGGEVINIGCNDRHSVNEMAELVGGRRPKALMAEKKAEFVPARPGEARHTLADISLAKKLLGWKPEIKFKDGIEELKKLYKIS